MFLYSSRRVKLFFLEYQFDDAQVLPKIKTLIHNINEGASEERYVTMGITCNPELSNPPYGYLAMVKKIDNCCLKPSNVSINGVMPVASYRMKLDGIASLTNSLINTITVFSGVLGVFASSMQFERHDHEWSFASIKALLKGHSINSIREAIAECKLTPKDKQTSLQESVLKVQKELLVPDTAEIIPKCVIFLKDAKQHVQSEAVFVPNWMGLPLNVQDKSIMENLACLGDYINNPNIHQNCTLLIHGKSRKGKTEFAKMMAMTMALTYKGRAEARIIVVNTLDLLRSIPMHLESGIPILVDDCDPCNHAALIYSDVAIWKAFLQCKDVATIRGRFSDIIVAPRQPKIITSNAETVDEWIGSLSIHGSHRDSLKMRIVSISVSDSLYSGPAPLRPASLMQPVVSIADARQALSHLLS